MEGSPEEVVGLSVLQSVRCLECGAVYTKPTRGGTARANPGCPQCGYVGWMYANVPVWPAVESRDDETELGQTRARSG